LSILGAPAAIRTPGLRIRSPLLYPAELQAHCFAFRSVRLLKDKILTGSWLNLDFYSFPALEMQALTLSERSMNIQREILLSVKNPVQEHGASSMEKASHLRG
jgi:hypothetical protein